VNQAVSVTIKLTYNVTKFAGSAATSYLSHMTCHMSDVNSGQIVNGLVFTQLGEPCLSRVSECLLRGSSMPQSCQPLGFDALILVTPTSSLPWIPGAWMVEFMSRLTPLQGSTGPQGHISKGSGLSLASASLYRLETFKDNLNSGISRGPPQEHSFQMVYSCRRDT